MIYVQTVQVIWEPGKNLKLRKYKGFEIWLAEKFVEKVKRDIDIQRYRSDWRPLNAKYKRYKIRNGMSPKMWEATGELKDQLKVKVRGRIIVGFDNRRHHGGTGLRYLELSKILEYGSVNRNIPPRPLFRNVLYFMMKHEREYYNLYRKEMIR